MLNCSCIHEEVEVLNCSCIHKEVEVVEVEVEVKVDDILDWGIGHESHSF